MGIEVNSLMLQYVYRVQPLRTEIGRHPPAPVVHDMGMMLSSSSCEHSPPYLSEALPNASSSFLLISDTCSSLVGLLFLSRKVAAMMTLEWGFLACSQGELI